MKKRLGFAGAFYLAALAAGTFCATAHADVKYTESVKTDTGSKEAAAGTNTTTTWIADGLQRIESSIQYGPVKMKDITITSCEAGKMYKVDPELKIYTATSTESKPGSAPSTAPKTPNAAAPKTKAKKGSGKITNNISVKYLGEETVAERKCRHYMVETSMKMEGCAGDGELKMKNEIWVADYKMPVFDCGDRPGQGGMGYGGGSSDCDLSFVQNGDTKLLADAYRGLIMRMKTFMPAGQGKEMTTTREITSLSEAKLEGSIFAIPADYKLVTDEEFQKERSSAMMKGMMSGMGAAGAGNGDNDGDEAENNTRDDANDNDKDETEQPEEQPKPKKPKSKWKLPF